MTKIRILNKYENEALKEIGNIGIGNCATSLSKLVNCFVYTRILDAGFELIENVPEITGSSEFPVFGAFMQIKETLTGISSFFFPKKAQKFSARTFQIKRKTKIRKIQ